MRRRDIMVGLGIAASPIALRTARAQQPGGRKRVGILTSGAESDPNAQERIVAFRQGIELFGWSEGRNLRIDVRYSAPHPERLPQLAKELLALKPDLIFAHTTPAAKVLPQETAAIPVVFVNVSDPIGSGVVSSLAAAGR